MKIIAHTMEYRGRSIVSPLRLRNYSAFDYEEYKRIYEECFRDMRTALQRFPVDCCDSKEELEHKKDKIYILEIDGKLVGSVAIYDNEIDDLIVGKSYQRAGYGEALLQFAISHMQTINEQAHRPVSGRYRRRQRQRSDPQSHCRAEDSCPFSHFDDENNL